MNRFSILAVAIALCFAASVHAQDAATEERLNKLAGQIEDLRANQEALHKQVQELIKALDAVREQASKPVGNFAGQEDLKRVADAVKEVDQKRIDDAEKVRSELLNLRKSLMQAPALKKSTPAPASESTQHSDKNDKGYEYVVKNGDTLSKILKAYSDNNLKVVSMEQVLKANPDLKPDRMRVGQKIFLPAPSS